MPLLTRFLFALLAVTFMTQLPADSSAADTSAYEKLVFEHEGKQLNTRLFTPSKLEQGKKYPLIIFLHGAGERGNNNEAQLKHGAGDLASDLVQAENPSYVLAPQVPTDQKWVDASWSGDSHKLPSKPSEAMGLTMKLVEQLIEQKQIDTNRIYVTGLSMGGFGTWDLMARWPHKIAAAIPICGGGDPTTAKAISEVPVWVFHGDADTAVKVQRSRDMVAALKAAGGEPKYTEYEGVGHDSWSRTYSNPEVYKWLFSQELKKES